MSNPRSQYLFVALMPFLVSCNSLDTREKVPLAKVDNQVLYLSEVTSVIPNDISQEDSLLLAEDYVHKWIRNELLISKAEENLTLSQRDVNKELKEYRNSLIIYRYKKELLQEKLDTSVTETEIRDFYNTNKDNFILGNDLVKAIFVKIPLQVSKPEQVKAFCNLTTGEDLQELQEYCLRNAESYEIHVDKWIDARIIFRKLPEINIDDISALLKRSSFHEIRDEAYYYLISVQGYRLRGDVAPMEYVAENVRNLILNKRRIDFLKKIEDDIYTEGLRKQKFKIYEYETN